MDESIWRDQWFKNIQRLHNLVRQKDKQLADSGGNVRIISRFIDAADLNPITDLAKKHDHVFLITEQVLAPPASNVTVIPVPHSFYGLYLYDFVDPGTTITKDFNCFINRNDPIRQTWFYLLFSRQLLTKGFVSFNLLMRENQPYPVRTESEYFHWIHEKYLSSFDFIKSDIEKILPYRNFIDNGNLAPVIMSSKFSIIIETYFERTDCKVLSEKTFRALHFPRPWLLFAATGCVQRLRDFGFDVFDDYVDHGYDTHDTSTNCVARQEAILEQCAKLQNLSITEDVLTDWQRKAEHNRAILKQWNQIYSTDFDSLLQKICHADIST